MRVDNLRPRAAICIYGARANRLRGFESGGRDRKRTYPPNLCKHWCFDRPYRDGNHRSLGKRAIPVRSWQVGFKF